MPEKFRKFCKKCNCIFESHGNKNCPKCGSDEWNFIDENNKKRVFVYEEIARRRNNFKDIMNKIRDRQPEGKGMTEKQAEELLEQTYPMP